MERMNDGIDRGPFGALVEEVIEITDRGKKVEPGETIQGAMEQPEAQAPQQQDQTAVREESDEPAG